MIYMNDDFNVFGGDIKCGAFIALCSNLDLEF